MRRAIVLFVSTLLISFIIPFLSFASQQGKPDLKIGEFKVIKVETQEVPLRLEIFLSIKNTGNAAADNIFVVSLFYRTSPSDPWSKLQDSSFGPLAVNEET